MERRPGGSRKAPAIIAALVLGLVVVGYRRSKGPEPAPVRTHAPRAESAPEESPPAPPPPHPASLPDPEPIEKEAPAPARRRTRSHTADPCRPVVEPKVPDGFDEVTAEGITVAWPLDGPPVAEPTALAYLIAGLLEEAALFTGTARRERVTVVRYASNEDLHQRGGAPTWASGMYDGTVKVPADQGADFGVRLKTLRHELMHAQLHTGVGCTPLWLNEGTAMAFDRAPPRHAWTRMLRTRRLYDFTSLAASSIDEKALPDVELVYGQSLTMVLFLAGRGPEALKNAIEELRNAPRTEAVRAARGLWDRLHPGVSQRDLLDSLSRRMLGLPMGRELDELLQGAVCCWGMSRLDKFGCRGAPLNGDKNTWIDESQKPSATCERD